MQDMNLSRHNFLEFESFINHNKVSVTKLDMVYEYINKNGFDNVVYELLGECINDLEQCQADYETFFNCVDECVDINAN